MRIFKKILVKLYPTHGVITQNISKIRPFYKKDNQEFIDDIVKRLEPYTVKFSDSASLEPDYLKYHEMRLQTAQFYIDLENERVKTNANKILNTKYDNNLIGTITHEVSASSYDSNLMGTTIHEASASSE